MANTLRKLMKPETELQRVENLYMYYRAQTIISRKVLKELEKVDKLSAEHIFSADALNHVLELYTTFKTQSEKKMNDVAVNNPTIYKKLSYQLAEHGVHTIEEAVLHELYERQLITPKLYIALKEELLK